MATEPKRYRIMSHWDWPEFHKKWLREQGTDPDALTLMDSYDDETVANDMLARFTAAANGPFKQTLTLVDVPPPEPEAEPES